MPGSSESNFLKLSWVVKDAEILQDMALYDNRFWLISHIRNSFVSSDDTGMCEAVITDELPQVSCLFADSDKYPHAEDSDEEEEMYNSFDLQSDWDFGGHRHRTNTAQRLEKMEQAKQKAAKIKHVKWDYNPNVVTSQERELLFERKILKKSCKVVHSLLADEIDKCPFLPKNPFNEYAKFDGNSQVGVPTRTYKIFLTMLPRPECDYPLQVCVLGSAKVSELIGYVCWKYMMQNINSNHEFRENIDSYGLFIAEDDGEVDWDFSCLDPKETVGKFGLAYLAMVELCDKNVLSEGKTEELFKVSHIEESNTLERTNDCEDLKRLKGDLTAIEALLYQSFQVHIVNRMRTKNEILLGISGDKVEIDPVVQNHTKVSGKLWKQKAMAYDIDSVVSCELLDTKSSNKASFRIKHYSIPYGTGGHSGLLSFKNHDFEADQSVAEEIVKKVNYILQLRSGARWREYSAFKQKKTRRRSFNIWPR